MALKDSLIVGIGDRVELHPATDAWMMGDRYGEIVKIGHKYVYVKMNRSGRTRSMLPKNVLTLDKQDIGK